MKKKIVAILLLLVMAATMMPMMAYADDEGSEPTDTFYYCNINKRNIISEYIPVPEGSEDESPVLATIKLYSPKSYTAAATATSTYAANIDVRVVVDEVEQNSLKSIDSLNEESIEDEMKSMLTYNWYVSYASEMPELLQSGESEKLNYEVKRNANLWCLPSFDGKLLIDGYCNSSIDSIETQVEQKKVIKKGYRTRINCQGVKSVELKMPGKVELGARVTIKPEISFYSDLIKKNAQVMHIWQLVDTKRYNLEEHSPYDAITAIDFKDDTDNFEIKEDGSLVILEVGENEKNGILPVYQTRIDPTNEAILSGIMFSGEIKDNFFIANIEIGDLNPERKEAKKDIVTAAMMFPSVEAEKVVREYNADGIGIIDNLYTEEAIKNAKIEAVNRIKQSYVAYDGNTHDSNLIAEKKQAVTDMKALAEKEGDSSIEVRELIDKLEKEISELTSIAEVKEAAEKALVEVEIQIGKNKRESVFLLKGTTLGNRANKLKWNKLKDATKYVVYGNQYGKKMKKLATVKGNTYKAEKINGKKLTTHKIYEFYVAAYKGNAKLKISKKIQLITAKTKGKYANAKSITAGKKNIRLTKGHTKKLTAKTHIYKSKKHIKGRHGASLRYVSDNPFVATVDKKGNVTARHYGTCNIYIQDISGLYCKTAVTVGK